MSELDTLVHELRTLAGEVDQFAGGRGISRHAWHVMLVSSVDCMYEAADTIEKLEPHSNQHEPSRWHQLFGTPERAARTVANICQFTHGGELCDRCQCYLFGECDRKLRLMSERSIYDALLGWLRGDA